MLIKSNWTGKAGLNWFKLTEESELSGLIDQKYSDGAADISATKMAPNC